MTLLHDDENEHFAFNVYLKTNWYGLVSEKYSKRHAKIEELFAVREQGVLKDQYVTSQSRRNRKFIQA